MYDAIDDVYIKLALPWLSNVPRICLKKKTQYFGARDPDVTEFLTHDDDDDHGGGGIEPDICWTYRDSSGGGGRRESLCIMVARYQDREFASEYRLYWKYQVKHKLSTLFAGNTFGAIPFPRGKLLTATSEFWKHKKGTVVFRRANNLHRTKSHRGGPTLN